MFLLSCGFKFLAAPSTDFIITQFNTLEINFYCVLEYYIDILQIELALENTACVAC